MGESKKKSVITLEEFIEKTEEKLDEAVKQGIEQGVQQGLEQAIERGIEIGIEDQRGKTIEMIVELVKEGLITEKIAAEKLDLTLDELKSYL